MWPSAGIHCRCFLQIHCALRRIALVAFISNVFNIFQLEPNFFSSFLLCTTGVHMKKIITKYKTYCKLTMNLNRKKTEQKKMKLIKLKSTIETTATTNWFVFRNNRAERTHTCYYMNSSRVQLNEIDMNWSMLFDAIVTECGEISMWICTNTHNKTQILVAIRKCQEFAFVLLYIHI